MLVRCTAKLLDLLDASTARLVADEPADDDWYANVVSIERRKCLVLMHAGTLFPVLVTDVRKRELVPFGPWLASAVAAALADEQLPGGALGAIEAERARLARTADRSLIGFMNEIGRESRYLVEVAGGLNHSDARDVNRRLRRTLHNRGGYRNAMELVAQWAAGS